MSTMSAVTSQTRILDCPGHIRPPSPSPARSRISPEDYVKNEKSIIDRVTNQGCCGMSNLTQKILSLALAIIGLLTIFFSAGVAGGIALLDTLGGTPPAVLTFVGLAATLLTGVFMSAIGIVCFQSASNRERVAVECKAHLDIDEARRADRDAEVVSAEARRNADAFRNGLNNQH